MASLNPIMRKDVEAFCNECVLLRAQYVHFQTLFEDGGDLRKELLFQIAPIFFGDVCATLRNAVIGGVCRLTDPAKTRGDENLTVELLADNSDYPDQKAKRRAESLKKKLHAMRDRLKPARHKRIAHFDRQAAHLRASLGKATPRQWKQFWLDLEEFLTILRQRYIGKADMFRLTDIAGVSDADWMVKALKESTYFHELAADRKLATRCLDIALKSKYSQT